MLVLLLALSCVEAVKKSSLFEAYAMAPYGYYYPPPYAPYNTPYAPQYQQPPPYAGPPPPGYFPPYMPPPQAGYYDPRYGMQFAAPERQQQYQAPPVLQGPPSRAVAAPVQEMREEPVKQAPQVVKQTVETTPSPLKVALAEALSEASKQIDKANAQTASHLVSFDNLDYSPRHNPPPVSLSQDTVPIDDHILNWRELVGISGSNLAKDPPNPVSEDGVTPLLAGHVNDRLR